MNNPPGSNANEAEEKYRHEKEHLKKIFIKFVDSALQGYRMSLILLIIIRNKDAEELLKVVLTLLEVPEQDKALLIAGFKSKVSKKGMFSKMFS